MTTTTNQHQLIMPVYVSRHRSIFSGYRWVEGTDEFFAECRKYLDDDAPLSINFNKFIRECTHQCKDLLKLTNSQRRKYRVKILSLIVSDLITNRDARRLKKILDSGFVKPDIFALHCAKRNMTPLVQHLIGSYLLESPKRDIILKIVKDFLAKNAGEKYDHLCGSDYWVCYSLRHSRFFVYRTDDHWYGCSNLLIEYFFQYLYTPGYAYQIYKSALSKYDPYYETPPENISIFLESAHGFIVLEPDYREEFLKIIK